MLSTSFRNTLIASTLLVGASILVSPAAFAGNSGQVSGTIAEINVVNFTAPSNATVTVGQGFTDNFSLGSVTIQNNDPDGWNLSVASANSGNLKLGITSHVIPYSAINLGDVPGVTETTTPVSPADANPALLSTAPFSTTVASGTTAINLTATLTVPNVPAGQYTDTLTFTLTSK